MGELQLSVLQRERDAWVAHNFPGDEAVDSFMGAVEELGELAHAMLKHKQNIRGMDDAVAKAAIKDAVADCIIFLAGIASHYNFDYGLAVQETWDRVKQRDWQAHPENADEHVDQSHDKVSFVDGAQVAKCGNSLPHIGHKFLIRDTQYYCDGVTV